MLLPGKLSAAAEVVDNGLEATATVAAEDEEDDTIEEEDGFCAIDFGCFFFASTADGAG